MKRNREQPISILKVCVYTTRSNGYRAFIRLVKSSIESSREHLILDENIVRTLYVYNLLNEKTTLRYI